MPSNIWIVFAVAVAVAVAVSERGASQDAESAAGGGWSVVPVPGSWEDASGGVYARHDGFAWYRAYVRVPDGWTVEERSLWTDSLSVAVDGVGDAYELFLNGTRVGAAGALPPAFRSGEEEWHYHRIPPGLLRPGVYNTVALRLYDGGGKGGFLGGAPVVSTYNREIELRGNWEFRPGDDASWAAGPVPARPAAAVFEEVRNAVALLRKPTAFDSGEHLSPSESLRRMVVAEDLAVDLVLSEPEISQPVSMVFDERGRLWVVEYRQYPYPAGLEVVSRDMYFRAVYDKVPPPPPRHVPGEDRISIHTDTDGDGSYDAHAVFAGGLNMVTSVALGRGGVWVLNPPYLLFYPDADRDDAPDSDPVVHLEGFGLEDAHSLANSLAWGPDGWLYAAQGSTVSGAVRRPGDREAVHTMGPLIWRYHPALARYEVFAEGGGNTFSVEIDAAGRLFSGTNDGNARGYHYVQGGYHSQAGSGVTKYGAQTNPYAFGHLPPMAHGPAPRFSHAFVIYEEALLPEPYRGKLIGVEPLQRRVVLSERIPSGSTFRTEDVSRPLTSEDPAFRPVAIAIGPAGAVYVADFCEEFIAHGQHYRGQLDPSTGRIWRLRPREGFEPKGAFDLAARSSRELCGLLADSSRWVRQAALRILADRRDRSERPLLRAMVAGEPGSGALDALWGLHLSGGLEDADALAFLEHPDPHVRLWTVRLVSERRARPPGFAGRLASLAETETDLEVRSQIACSIRKLPVPEALAALHGLATRDEDSKDPYLPLLLWWALESAADDRAAVLDLFAHASFRGRPLVRDHLTARLARRWALAGTREDLVACARLLELASSGERPAILEGLQSAWRGRALPSLPEELLRAMEAAGGGSLAFRLRRRDLSATEEALRLVASAEADPGERELLVRVLGEVPQARALPVLLRLLDDESRVRTVALAALRGYEGDSIVDAALQVLPRLAGAEREAAEVLLASRPEWTERFLGALEAGELEPSAVSASGVEQMVRSPIPSVREQAARLWPDARALEPLDAAAEIERLGRIAGAGGGNLYAGKRLFANRCGRCHRLFNDGGALGPDLTAYPRGDLERMLRQVVEPSAEVREGYEEHVVVTVDGRIASGLLVDEDSRVLVVRGVDGQDVSLPRDAIATHAVTGRSLMPEGLLRTLSEPEIGDLFAYLRSTQPVPD